MKRTKLNLKIERDIPIPPVKRGSSRSLKYPWDKMTVGDSIFVPLTEKVAKESVRTAATTYGKRRDMIFVTRVVDGGVRVWRTK